MTVYLSVTNSAARIGIRDVRDLAIASAALAAVADAIQRAKPAWGPPCIAMLISANDTLVRLNQKGIAAFRKAAVRFPGKFTPELLAQLDAGTQEAPEPETPPEEPKEG